MGFNATHNFLTMTVVHRSQPNSECGVARMMIYRDYSKIIVGLDNVSETKIGSKKRYTTYFKLVGAKALRWDLLPLTFPGLPPKMGGYNKVYLVFPEGALMDRLVITSLIGYVFHFSVQLRLSLIL